MTLCKKQIYEKQNKLASLKNEEIKNEFIAYQLILFKITMIVSCTCYWNSGIF